ncbi:MAG: hypothetical protein ACR2K2_00785 [Mycobacteriales bacterium]
MERWLPRRGAGATDRYAGQGKKASDSETHEALLDAARHRRSQGPPAHRRVGLVLLRAVPRRRAEAAWEDLPERMSK